jgi:hypothetical protein
MIQLEHEQDIVRIQEMFEILKVHFEVFSLLVQMEFELLFQLFVVVLLELLLQRQQLFFLPLPYELQANKREQ